MTRSVSRSVGTILLIGLLGAYARTAAQAPTARPPEPGPDLSPGEVVRLFDAYAVVQAQEMLRLSDAQYGPFVSRLKALQETRRRLQRERGQILQDLGRLSQQQNPLPDELSVRDRIKALQELEDRAVSDIRKAYDAVDQVLDVRQQGRFRVFEEQMERRKLELVGRVRATNRPLVRRPRP